MLQSFASVIDAFDGPAAFAREVGMSPGAAKQAKRRDSLAAEWFLPTAMAAKRKGFEHINEMSLLELAQRRGRRAADQDRAA